MDFLLELIFEVLANRFGLFLLGVILIIGGGYVWYTYRHDARLYDAAVSSEGRTVEARVRVKGQEISSSSTSASDTLVDYFVLSYEADGEVRQPRIYVTSGEYHSTKEGGTIQIKYHPANPDFIVTAGTERHSAVFASVVAGGMVVLGILLIAGVLISLFA